MRQCCLTTQAHPQPPGVMVDRKEAAMTNPGTLLVAGAAAVGCSALLGVVFWMLIICLIIELIVFSVLCKFVCEDYQRYRQRNKNKRKNGCGCGEPSNASAGSIGNLGEASRKSVSGSHARIIIGLFCGKKPQNLSRRALWLANPIALFRPLVRFSYFFRCWHKRKSVTPNVQSSGTRDQPA